MKALPVFHYEGDYPDIYSPLCNAHLYARRPADGFNRTKDADCVTCIVCIQILSERAADRLKALASQDDKL